MQQYLTLRQPKKTEQDMKVNENKPMKYKISITTHYKYKYKLRTKAILLFVN